MGLFDKFRAGLQNTQAKLVHEVKRIVTRSPRLTEEDLEELEAALLAADFGLDATRRISEAVRKSYESQGADVSSILDVAKEEVARAFEHDYVPLAKAPDGVTVVVLVGVNGTGKTTTAAKLAHSLKQQGQTAVLAACDTFRAAAIEQLKIWGERLNVPVVASAYGADPASVAHDALLAAQSRGADYLIIDTAGRLHTKQNLMLELQKVLRVISRKHPGAPHEILLVLDATTGMNALAQAREFHKAVRLTGLVITKLDGTSKGGMVVSIQKEVKVPVKFIGLGEKPNDFHHFEAAQFAGALFSE